MFSKFTFVLLCLFAIVPLGLAIPAPSPAALVELEARQAQSVLNVLKNLQKNVAPVLKQLPATGGNTAQVNSLLGKATSMVNTATQGVSANSTIPAADVASIVSLIIQLILQLLTALLPILLSLLLSGLAGGAAGGNAGGLVALDGALTSLLNALAALNPAMLGSVGNALPVGAGNLLDLLGLGAALPPLGL